MNYKIEKKLQDNKKYLIVFLILWIVLEILLIAPIAVAINNNTINEKLDFGNCIVDVFKEIYQFKAITKLAVGNTMAIFGKTTLWFTIIFIIAITIGLIKSKSKNNFKDIENGSSDWSRGGEQYRILSKNKGIILAEDNYLPIDKMGNINVLVVGGSGSGKSACYSKPNAYQMLGSYVFTDPKGELYDDTAGFLKQNGYDIKVLNLVNPENSDGYNPLMHINSNIDVDVIAHTIVKGQEAEGKSSDPFWDDNAEMLLKALIYYLIATRPPEEQNLASCAELVRAANSNNGTSLLSELINELPFDHPARTNFKSIELASEKTFSSILSTLQSKLGKFDSKEIAEVTSTNTINFEDIATHKTALYVISSDTHTAYNFLLTIFFAQMIQQLYNFADQNGGKLPIRTYFILDEFANIGQIPDFDKKISTSRSRGISFSVILQNLDQLEAVYEKSYETIMGNCDTHVFLGSNSFKTVEYFSKQLGETTILRDTKSINRNKDYSKSGFNTSDQVMGRALMTPDELRRMDNDLCIIFEKGLKPIKAKKFYYFRKPMAREFQRYKISHNDFNSGVRGEWRKFNPANPYTETNNNEKEQDLKVESLDDLFESDDTTPKVEQVATNNQQEYTNISETKPTNNSEEAPVLPMEDNTKQDELFTKDLQEELEAKFDELFGPIDNNEN
jgi:type IV secretion system protein VirD4